MLPSYENVTWFHSFFLLFFNIPITWHQGMDYLTEIVFPKPTINIISKHVTSLCYRRTNHWSTGWYFPLQYHISGRLSDI